MEETKWLKPSVKRVTKYGDSASVQAVTRVNAEQASKRTMRRPTRRPFRGRLTRLGELSEDYAQPLHRGSGGSMYTRKAHATREAPWRGRGRLTGSPRGKVRAPWGGGEARGTAEAGETPVEGRGLSSRQTQYVVRDLGIGKPINSD